MKIEEEKEVTRVQSTTVGYKCDVCGKITDSKSFPMDWHSFSSNHNEWGNDSIDSYKYHEVCSPECYTKKLSDILSDELKGRYDAEVDDMEIKFAIKFSEMLNKIERI